MTLLDEINLTAAFEALEDLRARLGADRITAVFPTQFGSTACEVTAVDRAVIHDGRRLAFKDPE